MSKLIVNEITKYDASQVTFTDNTNVVITGSLSTAGASVGGTLAVSGAATLSSTLGVTGAATLSSTLAVTGASTLSGLVSISKIVNSATLPDAPSSHSLTLYPPSTTGYYGGGISWSEGTDTAASINAVDDGAGGALGLVLSTGNNTTITERARFYSSGDISFRDSSANEAFYWDASAASLGIGTAPSQGKIHLYNSGSAANFYIESDASNNTVTSQISLGGASGRAALIQGYREASSNLHALIFRTYDSGAYERMRIAANGFVGIGSSTTYSIGTGFGSLTVSGTSGGGINLGSSSTNFGQAYGSSDGLTVSAFDARNIAFRTNDTERMRISSSGNVGIGVNASDYWTNANNLVVGSLGAVSGITIATDGNLTGSLIFADGTGGGDNARGGLQYNHSTDYMLFRVDNAERMRITSGGYLKASNNGVYNNASGTYHELRTSSGGQYSLMVSNTNTISPFGVQIFYPNTLNDTTNRFIDCEDNTALRFSVRSNGGLANYQANDVNLSDERVKTDISPLGSYWDKIKAIEIVNFKYKDQTHDDFNIGVIAQQVESIAPEFVDIDGFDNRPKIISEEVLDEEGNVIQEAVYEEPLAEPLKAVYTADLYHAAIKVLQEAMARIEVLETELNALKQA